jgi:hypothetical protein
MTRKSEETKERREEDINEQILMPDSIGMIRFI